MKGIYRLNILALANAMANAVLRTLRLTVIQSTTENAP